MKIKFRWVCERCGFDDSGERNGSAPPKEIVDIINWLSRGGLLFCELCRTPSVNMEIDLSDYH